ncbi:MAG: hypothetical protein WBF17_08065 [Phycisphaerae bacterium]
MGMAKTTLPLIFLLPALLGVTGVVLFVVGLAVKKAALWGTGIGLVVLAGLVLAATAAFVWVREDHARQVTCTYEVLRKSPDGETQVVSQCATQKPTTGTIEGTHPGIGKITVGPRAISRRTATIQVEYPDGTTAELELGLNETKEHFHSGGAYGVRGTLNRFHE